MNVYGNFIVGGLWIGVWLYAITLADTAGYSTPLGVALIVVAFLAAMRWWKYMMLLLKPGKTRA